MARAEARSVTILLGRKILSTLRRWFPATTPKERKAATITAAYAIAGLRAEQRRRLERGSVAEARAALADLESALVAVKAAALAVDNIPRADEWWREAIARPALGQTPGDGLLPDLGLDRAAPRARLLGDVLSGALRDTRQALASAPDQGRPQPRLEGLDVFAIDMRRIWESLGPRNNRHRLIRRWGVSRQSPKSPPLGDTRRWATPRKAPEPGPVEFVSDMLILGGFEAEPTPIREAIGKASASATREKRVRTVDL
jgi:hypothetical protein